MAGFGKLAVIGQGYVGLPLALRAAEAGWEVTGIDLDESRVVRLKQGDSFVEDVTNESLGSAIASNSYMPTASYGEATGFDVAVIAVPTPLRDGVPDLSSIRRAADSLGPYVRIGCTLVLESTTYPGTTDGLLRNTLEAASGLRADRDFYLGYSPERIDPGNPYWHLGNTPKIVSGVGERSLAAVREFYETFVETVVPVSNCREAELAKLVENTFRHVNIALVNEISMLARALSIDVWAALDAAATKPFGFMRFAPGPGVGGHCLPIDPSYLSWHVERVTGHTFRFVELANDINSHMPEYVVQRVIKKLNHDRKSVNGSRILLLGLAYKKNTGDARESPAVRVAELLLELGAVVAGADPHVTEEHGQVGLARVSLTPTEVAWSDVILLLTDHDTFDYGLIASARAKILDTRGRMRNHGAEQL